MLAASKSWVGHAEPAAGLAGLLFARAAASQALSLPLLHLRAVNTYVANALEQQPVKGGVAPALLPKQSGPGPFTSSLATWGVSAFAFQVGGGCTTLGVAVRRCSDGNLPAPFCRAPMLTPCSLPTPPPA